jgi:enterochelin esterase family protein
MTRTIGAVLLAFVLSPAVARAQDTVAPHEVHADGRITFRYRAPDAGRVVVVREGVGRVLMARGEDGVWQFTTEPLVPEIYAYHFEVDGEARTVEDADGLPTVMGGRMGLAHVPGPDTLVWERSDAQRGRLRRHRLASERLGEDRELLVYEPPGYDADAAYPVLYLLHGVLGDERSWATAGRADVILDNLAARGEVVPMLVVMPLSYGFTDPWTRTMGLLTGAVPALPALDTFRLHLIEEIVPLIEREYRIAPGSANRAIAGLSMGGAEAVHIGLRHPDRFGWIGSFGGAFLMYAARFDELFPDLAPVAGAMAPRLLRVEVGDRDFLLGINRTFVEWLGARGVRVEYEEVEGGHEWFVWRRALVRWATRVFQPAGDDAVLERSS